STLIEDAEIISIERIDKLDKLKAKAMDRSDIHLGDRLLAVDETAEFRAELVSSEDGEGDCRYLIGLGFPFIDQPGNSPGERGRFTGAGTWQDAHLWHIRVDRILLRLGQCPSHTNHPSLASASIAAFGGANLNRDFKASMSDVEPSLSSIQRHSSFEFLSL